MSSHYRNSRPPRIDTNKIRASFVPTDDISNLYSKNGLHEFIISTLVILISSLFVTVLLYKKQNPDFQFACLQYLNDEQKKEFKSLFKKVVIYITIADIAVRIFMGFYRLTNVN